MALRFMDSFDHYATADITMKWNAATASTVTISSGNGRRSGGCMRFSSLSAATSQKTLTALASYVVGFAFKTNLLMNGVDIYQAKDGSTIHLSLRMNNTGTISVMRGGAAGTVLGTSSTALSTGTYYYMEFKFTINDSTGSFTFRINGGSEATGSSVDTRNGGNATVDNFTFGLHAGSGGATMDVDDLYILDTTGSANNDLLGDVRVDCYLPSGNGNSSQLVGSDSNSTDNYLLVDESSQNGDTDYVQSATVNNKDTYAFADMSHTPASIFGTQLNMIAKKDDSGTRSICSVTRSGGTDYDGTTQALGTTYVDYSDLREVDPATSAAWTRTNLNNAEFGVKVAA